MLELSIRDVGIKGNKLRNKGLVTETLRRKDGQIIPIFLSSNLLEQYIVITDYCKDLDVKFENEIISDMLNKLGDQIDEQIFR